jgi:hypothetical protein
MFATVDEIAAAENINASYVGRVLRLTLLAPDIVEAILDGRQPAGMTLAVLMRPFAVGWGEQLMRRARPRTDAMFFSRFRSGFRTISNAQGDRIFVP